MKQFTTRSPFLTFTHSRCRGDWSSRALAQSWAGALKAAKTGKAAVNTPNVILFMSFLNLPHFSNLQGPARAAQTAPSISVPCRLEIGDTADCKSALPAKGLRRPLSSTFECAV